MPTLDILGGAANAAVGGALGIGTAAINSSIQNNQQANLMQMQDRYNEIQTQRNIQAQLDLWDKTNYSAQVEQMKKAGINPALLYGKGGAGGATTAANTVNNTAPSTSRPMEIQQMMGIALQNQMQQAQIKNIEADTKGKEISNANEGEGGINQQLKFANIDNLIANTNNTEAKTKLTEAQIIGQEITNAKDNATLEASINKAYTEMELAMNMLTESDIRTGAMVENKEAFMENYKQQLAAQAILNKLNQSQTNVNNQQVKNLQESINLIKSQTNLNEQQIQNLLQAIVNMKTENINNTIKTNQGNRQLELKSREID